MLATGIVKKARDTSLTPCDVASGARRRGPHRAAEMRPSPPGETARNPSSGYPYRVPALDYRTVTLASLESALDQATPDEISRAIRFAERCNDLNASMPGVRRIYEAVRFVLEFELTHGDANPEHANAIAAEVEDWLFEDDDPSTPPGV